MDLGCLDLGCLDKVAKHGGGDARSSPGSDGGGSDSSGNLTSSASKFGKRNSPRGSGQSSPNALNKVTSQIKKPSRRKTSPLNWFPRKKVDSYLKRKIQMLQEVDGMKQTLDETLGDSNPHYCRVLREKMAAREAASKVMEAQKAALVEASWYRTLKAARIHNKEAEDLLAKAENAAAEAFEAATAVGVIMDDMPSCPQNALLFAPSKTTNKAGSTTTGHTVKASFETAFDVDKEVAAAVKVAFIRLAATCPPSDQDEFRDLLQKISQNPESSVYEGEQEDLKELSAESGSDSGSEPMSTSPKSSQKKKKRQSVELVNMMLDRLKSLKEDELSSLATIVATCGLSAALAEVESIKLQRDHPISTEALSVPRRSSSVDAGKKQGESELPSLDKFLVKHMSKLEKEVEQAKNNRKKEAEGARDASTNDDKNGKVQLDKKASACDIVPDLGSILVKHSSRIEREIQEAKRNSAKDYDYKTARKKPVHEWDSSCEVEQAKNNRKKEAEGARDASTNDDKNGKVQLDKKASACDIVPDLGSILVKHSSRIEREIQEAKRNSAKDYDYKTARKKPVHEWDSSCEVIPDLASIMAKRPTKPEIENQEAKQDSEKLSKWVVNRPKAASSVPGVPSLDEVLVKHVSRLEKEVQEAKNRSRINEMAEQENVDFNKVATISSDSEFEGKTMRTSPNLQEDSLEKILIKPVSRLERENTMQAKNRRSEYNRIQSKQQQAQAGRIGAAEEGLEKVLVKHVSKLEREKMESRLKEDDVKVVQRRGKNLQQAQDDRIGAAEEGLEKVLVKHVSKLEREKMESRLKEDDVKVVQRRGRNLHLQQRSEEGSLDQILVKHKSRLEKEKMSAFEKETGEHARVAVSSSMSRREVREKELEESWGGLSFGNSLRPHFSKLQRDKAAWIKADEEERRQVV
ncbi:unnamed protein product [Linum tenue]|uniref:Uncharacterized protein n=1 Tax=Linum tenue TaxID=586396 RepID=A0AAV0PI33_9ROSI|nr:unnamed protein product [Linum tenue]